MLRYKSLPKWSCAVMSLSLFAVIVLAFGRGWFSASIASGVSAAERERSMMGSDYPLSPIDKNIDRLGEPSHMTSEADAEAYVNALLEKFRLDESVMLEMGEFKRRLVRAEFSSVQDPEKRIAEGKVADVFNGLMDEWQTPDWTRVSPAELHAFRVTMSLGLYPKSVTRLPDGSVSAFCRPVEALYLIYLLHANMGVSAELHDAIKAGRWTERDQHILPAQGSVRLGTANIAVDARRLHEYRAALNTYLAAHPNHQFQTLVDKLFARLGIEKSE